MSFLMILMTATVVVFAMASFISIKRHEKHDRVLFSFSRMQSAVMKNMLVRLDSGTLTRREYDSAVFLLNALDGVTSHYGRHKTTMFNLRKMRQMMKKFGRCNFGILALVGMLVILPGCSTQYHQESVRQDVVSKNITVGSVQQEIKVGMSGGEVVEILGSPNIVSTDENRNEVWVYDKISNEVAYSESGVGLIFFGAASGASSQSQRTLTIIIKFGKDRSVADISYHSSRF